MAKTKADSIYSAFSARNDRCTMPVMTNILFMLDTAMHNTDWAMLSAICAIFLLAGLVKGVIGLGLPTVAVGLLGLSMTPAEAAALLLVPSFVTNIWQLAEGPRLAPLLRRFWPMLLAIFGGTLLGGWLLGDTAHSHPIYALYAGAGLGAALMLYAIVGLSAFQLHIAPQRQHWLAPVVGAITGLVTAATGVFVIPAVPYLQALALERDQLIQALGLAFTVSTMALAAMLAINHSLPATAAGMSFAALAPAIMGMTLGKWLRGKIRPTLFRRCFFLGLLALGLHLVLHAISIS